MKSKFTIGPEQTSQEPLSSSIVLTDEELMVVSGGRGDDRGEDPHKHQDIHKKRQDRHNDHSDHNDHNNHNDQKHRGHR